jgi:dTDP-4-amino-4,6-dideoxygalactose transaminase
MWPRKQLDIGWSELAFGLGHSLVNRPRLSPESVVGPNWIAADEAIVALSVRTGWDLFLKAHALPPGSEIVVSGVTIPDMVRIIEHHGLVAIPVGVDANRLEPLVDELERSITPRTRAILVAHLFGTRIDMEPIVRLARQNNLLVVEDCAQAFIGRDCAGHDETDCTLFSFGPIKTATALGGAVLRVRDAGVREEMLARHAAYPEQARSAFLSRLVKYSLFRIICWPWVYGFLARLYRWCGKDFDRDVAKAAHSFPGDEFFEKIRRRPSNALLRLLQRRLETFNALDAPRLRRRTTRGSQLADSLPVGMVVGSQNETHTYWVMPVRVANVSEVVAALQRAGFDATSRSSLIVVPAPEGRGGDQPTCAPWLAETIFLPNGHDIPDSEWTRVSLILREVARTVPRVAVTKEQPAREPSAVVSVSVPS